MAKSKYAEPTTISVDEALGIDEKRINEKQARRLLLDMDDLIADHKADMEALKKSAGDIGKAVSDYEKEGEDREPAEIIYDKSIRIIYGMAGRFHPLSQYGKKMLNAAIVYRQKFEKSVGPMISTITKNNINLFRTVLPVDLYEDIVVGRRRALGAIRTIKGKTYGVAAIAYYQDRIETYEDPILRIDWLYVNEKFRGRGLSYFLLGELLYQVSKSGIAAVSAEFESGGEYNYLLGYILGTWRFEFGTGLSTTSVIRLGDITGFSKISSKIKGVQTLASLDDISREKLITTAFRKFGYRGYLANVPFEYIDPETSCFLETPETVSALLIAHKLPSGMVRAEYEGLSNDQDSAVRVVCKFLESASLIYDDDDIIDIPIDSEELGIFLEDVCPGQMGQYTVEGILELLSDQDIDEKTVNELMK